MKKKIAAAVVTMAMVGMSLTGCNNEKDGKLDKGAVETESAEAATESDAGIASGKTTIYVDIAASMTSSFEEIVVLYAEKEPDVEVVINSGSSGTLMKQIEEANGIGHDLFFSAGKKQVQTLDEVDGLVVEESTVELLCNSLCLVTGVGSGTGVTGWDNMSDAQNMALCDGTVPVGKYSREAMVTLGILETTEDNSQYTAQQISEALGGVEINETADVAVAAQAVAEGSNEIGTVYYTDWYDWENDLIILAQDDNGELTGPIIYPVCLIKNMEADEAEKTAARDFLEFLQSEEVLKIFEEHCFIIK